MKRKQEAPKLFDQQIFKSRSTRYNSQLFLYQPHIDKRGRARVVHSLPVIGPRTQYKPLLHVLKIKKVRFMGFFLLVTMNAGIEGNISACCKYFCIISADTHRDMDLL